MYTNVTVNVCGLCLYNFQVLTFSSAASKRILFAPLAVIFVIEVPSVVAFTCTAPSMRACLARTGYRGICAEFTTGDSGVYGVLCAAAE